MALARASASVNPNEEYRLTDLAEGFADIELVGGTEQVIRHAMALSEWSGKVRERARNAKQEEKDPAEDEGVQEAITYLRHERKNFLEAAREDLLPTLPGQGDVLHRRLGRPVRGCGSNKLRACSPGKLAGDRTGAYEMVEQRKEISFCKNHQAQLICS